MSYDVEKVLQRALASAEFELDMQRKIAVNSPMITQPLEKAEEAHVRARLNIWIFENIYTSSGYRFK